MSKPVYGIVMIQTPDLISIITPAFNAEPYIARAVRSVIAQTHHNWELLLISDDQTNYQTVLSQQGISDPRIRFLSTNAYGAGVNHARSLALKHAEGEWIATLDADDSFMPKRLKKLLPLAQRFGMAADNVSVVDHRSDELLRTLFAADGGIHWLNANDYCQTDVPMTFLFRRSLITLPWQSDIELGEDTLFHLRLMEQLEHDVPVLSQSLHRYYVREDSICHSKDASERAERGYSHSLSRLADDGLGFAQPAFRDLVADMLTRKRSTNLQFKQAQSDGFSGSFQQFVATQHDAAVASQY
ncbi:hypothetical protein GCM10011369_21750 [Neiella marina]|uniref:Glycosyltransferase 2-like domain-containing protein n=1 Tax=Neiella marina TaxID=508461 RepID=A0A8J2U5P8_9GAMM|nr:glycosyltransferase family 2 protein [Neiella marina]GGA79445.1 hypothetical protein GCM10011369_21750 [Neiella marina]